MADPISQEIFQKMLPHRTCENTAIHPIVGIGFSRNETRAKEI
jgi:hypothetical protein